MAGRGVLREYVRGPRWALPTLSVLAAVAAGAVLSSASIGSRSPLAFQRTADDARILLSGITGTVITVIALLLGLTVVALTWFRPRGQLSAESGMSRMRAGTELPDLPLTAVLAEPETSPQRLRGEQGRAPLERFGAEPDPGVARRPGAGTAGLLPGADPVDDRGALPVPGRGRTGLPILVPGREQGQARRLPLARPPSHPRPHGGRRRHEGKDPCCVGDRRGTVERPVARAQATYDRIIASMTWRTTHSSTGPASTGCGCWPPAPASAS